MECLGINHYQTQIDNFQIVFMQRSVTTEVGATIEMESYVQSKPSQIAKIEPEIGTEPVTDAVCAIRVGAHN